MDGGPLSINFGPGRTWGAVSQVEFRRFARDPRHTHVYRVYFAALGWANLIGHAEFGQDELRQVLADGDGRVPSPQRVSQAVKAARDLGLVGGDSKARCLVLPHVQFQRGGMGSRSCRVHGVNRS